MKKKTCSACGAETAIAFRCRVRPETIWVFVCHPCLQHRKCEPGYQYGGTWKGARH